MMWFCSQQEIVIRQIGEAWNDTKEKIIKLDIVIPA